MDGGSEAVGRSMNDQNHSRVTGRPSAYPDGTSVRRLAGGTRCRGMSGPDHCRVRLPAVLSPFQYSILLVGRQHAGLVHILGGTQLRAEHAVQGCEGALISGQPASSHQRDPQASRCNILRLPCSLPDTRQNATRLMACQRGPGIQNVMLRSSPAQLPSK